jgi:predicted metalloprotease with PDZ domain
VQVGQNVELDVEAAFAGPLGGALVFDDEAIPFIDGLAVQRGNAFTPFAMTDANWSAGCASPCRVRYHVHLRKAAEQVHDAEDAILLGGVVFSPPSTWLAHPEMVPEDGKYRVHVSSAELPFVTALRPAASAADTYEASFDSFDESTFASFGPFTAQSIGSSGTTVVIAPGSQFSVPALRQWVEASLDAVTAYFGRPLDDRLTLFFAPGTAQGTRGVTLGGGGASVLVRIGTDVAPSTVVRDDWVVAHELIHVAFPDLYPNHPWFNEGLASYAEPIARAEQGIITAEKVWSDLIEGLPQGYPSTTDVGLDQDDTWGRVYWGGAAYFLLADVGIREQTRGGKGLGDAVRAMAAGADVEVHRPFEAALEAGDRATGTHVLVDLYRRFGQARGAEDFDALFAKLGIRRQGGNVTVAFDDSAPLASVRRAITAPLSPNGVESRAPSSKNPPLSGARRVPGQGTKKASRGLAGSSPRE